VITEGSREFAGRDWDAVRANKDEYWGERIARLGALEAFRIAEELRAQALATIPSWPDDALRSEDLHAHVRLSSLFRRAGPTRRR